VRLFQQPASSANGDAGDPVLARDSLNGAIYLLVNPSRETATWKGFRLWKSTDNGQSFTLSSGDVFNGAVVRGDKEMIAVNSHPNLPNSGYVYVAGGSQGSPSTVHVAYSANGGSTWLPQTPWNLGSGWSPDIAITPNGTVYVFYLVTTVSSPNYLNSIQYRWRRVGDSDWNGPATIAAHPGHQALYATEHHGSGKLRRSNLAPAEDWFVSNGFPRVAVNPINGHIFVVYADLPYAGSSTDRGDIFIQESWPDASGSLQANWSGAVRVNNDATATDQWNPAVTVNPAGTAVFVGYYSRQSRPAQNDLIKAYGAKANIGNGLLGTTFDLISLTANAFPPVFPGPTSVTPPENTWLYDHVWAQTGVCLNSNANVVMPCPPDFFWETSTTYQNFMADDYVWVSADGAYFYFAWTDRSEVFGNGGQMRRDANVRLGKVTN
jgi:hypothetical protein